LLSCFLLSCFLDCSLGCLIDCFSFLFFSFLFFSCLSFSFLFFSFLLFSFLFFYSIFFAFLLFSFSALLSSVFPRSPSVFELFATCHGKYIEISLTAFHRSALKMQVSDERKIKTCIYIKFTKLLSFSPVFADFRRIILSPTRSSFSFVFLAEMEFYA